MPLAEIAVRGWQEAAKLIDRFTTIDRPVDPPLLLREHAPVLADPHAAVAILRELVPQRFFQGAADPSLVARLAPDHREQIQSSAVSALQGRFDLLGYRNLWFGEPTDWHLDPVWSRRAPRVHWTQLDPLDASVVGDSKIVWELSRHQWVARLAAAYAFSGDERYADRAVEAIESWIEANPYGVGINWCSSLEAAYRVMSWSWVLVILRNSLALSEERLVGILANLWLHANHVARYLSYYFSPNTHLTGEALGLFYAATLFPEFVEARSWRDIGARILISQSCSQICGDGVHFERSTCYHRYTVETYEQFCILASRNNVAVPRELMAHLRRMVEFLLAMRLPDGGLPETGDADGGRLLPFVERGQCDPRGVFAVAATMFRRSDFAWAAGPATADVLWLLGQTGVESVASMKPVSAAPVSRAFPNGGYVVMKSGCERYAHQMIIDVGPLGCPVSSGHGHADLLSIQCTAFGAPVLVDAGTYCYTPEGDWRDFFRGTAAHSTVMVDGRNQVDPDGPFQWQGRPSARLREWCTNAERDFVDASHGAYAGITHRRRVLFVKPDYWVVVDDVMDDGDLSDAGDLSDVLALRPAADAVPAVGPALHQIDLGFQFAPIPVSVLDDRWGRAVTAGGNTFWVGSFGVAAIRPAVKIGELTPIRGWISPDYGQRTPSPFLVYSTRTALPWRSITLLIPQRGRASVPPAVSLLEKNGLPIGLELASSGQSILVDAADVFVHRS
jgi:hypothetical protein